ncbi:MAG: cytochrome b5 domain-containing protein [Candidatus Taylorbacteria bacterium]|nr:cytochrome b5 domain-containing protein [Candidatus Taylorbacteria bacterium]
MQYNIKKVVIFLVGAGILVLGSTLIVNSYQSDSYGIQSASNVQDIASSTPQGTYTLLQVGTHGSAADCWTTVRGNVYDVTTWIGKHPGGQEAILGMCGKDATAAFEGQHGGESRPEKELAKFKIGILVK